MQIIDGSSALNYFITTLMLCSPLTAIPVYLNLSAGRDKRERKKIGITAGIAVATILIVTTWIGAPLLSFLGIRIPAFQCAGGIVVFILALSMLNAELSSLRQNKEEKIEKAPSISVVPLAIPVMAGPGALSAVIVSASRFAGPINHVYLSLCNLCVGVITAILLYFALPLEKRLGSSGINIVTRIGGLILAAMAVEIFTSGLQGLRLILQENM